MSALLDTSFLFALTDASDRNHARVLAAARTLTEPLILPVPVLPEAGIKIPACHPKPAEAG